MVAEELSYVQVAFGSGGKLEGMNSRAFTRFDRETICSEKGCVHPRLKDEAKRQGA